MCVCVCVCVCVIYSQFLVDIHYLAKTVKKVQLEQLNQEIGLCCLKFTSNQNKHVPASHGVIT